MFLPIIQEQIKQGKEFQTYFNFLNLLPCFSLNYEKPNVMEWIQKERVGETREKPVPPNGII